MDKLKDFIDLNKEAFEEVEMPEGHFERFERKLERQGRRQPILLYGVGTIAAAAVAALLLLIGRPDKDIAPEPSEIVAQMCETREEFEETRLYYQMRMSEIVEQMRELYQRDRTPGAATLLRECDRMLADTDRFERNILPNLPCSNEGLFAMNQHYSNSLKGMHFMLEQMRQVTGQEEDN